VAPALPPSVKVPAPDSESAVALDLRDNLSGASPRQATRVTLARDATHLRLRFGCEDTQPWATLTRRDSPLYQEEVVEVNPLNTVLDLMLRKIGKGWRKELAWSCNGLETSVSRDAAGWSAALAIPFAALAPRPPAPGDVWRANFLRIDRPAGAPRELSAWSPTCRNTFHEPARFGFVEFQ